MKTTDIIGLRTTLDMSRAEFATLTATNARTVQRWEEGDTPAQNSGAILGALHEKLARSNPEEILRLTQLLRNAAGIGGLGYLIVCLLDAWTENIHLAARVADLGGVETRAREIETALSTTRIERDAFASALTEKSDLAIAVGEIQKLLGVKR